MILALQILNYILLAIQGLGLALLALSIGLFRTSQYKKEFILFGLSGLSLVIIGSLSSL